MMGATFFEYHCDLCDSPFCERIHVMNLALNHIEAEYCLDCLAAQEKLSPQDFYTWIGDYVMARDCFKTPWEHFAYAECPRIMDKTCFCSPVV